MAGNTEADRMTARRAGLRVSDAERDAVAAELAEHLKDGRLDTAEFDERVGQAVTAKTRGDLDRLLADLPRQEPVPPPTARRRAGWPLPLVPITFLVLFMAVASVAGRAHGAPRRLGALVVLLVADPDRDLQRPQAAAWRRAAA